VIGKKLPLAEVSLICARRRKSLAEFQPPQRLE
jgi:hypothetical protein